MSSVSDFHVSNPLPAQVPSFDSEFLPYLTPTPAEWASRALEDLGVFMSDHAWCERKASGNCLSLLAAHKEHPVLTEPMVRLAREELEHFHLVFNHMQKRGFVLLEETKDKYVRALRTFVRNDSFQLLDRILVAAIIESRSCERLGLISDELSHLHESRDLDASSGVDAELVDFYRRLTKAESRHFAEFIEIAVSIFGVEPTFARWSELLVFEDQEIKKIIWSCGVH